MLGISLHYSIGKEVNSEEQEMGSGMEKPWKLIRSYIGSGFYDPPVKKLYLPVTPRV